MVWLHPALAPAHPTPHPTHAPPPPHPSRSPDRACRFSTDRRTLRVLLDPSQYYVDTKRHVEEGGDDVYSSFNLVVRRKAKENNFKAVLETIRDLMQSNAVVPEWLHDIFLGYGDPGMCKAKKDTGTRTPARPR